MNQELIRTIESIAREKNIDPGTIFSDIELAMISAIRKANKSEAEVIVNISRETGEISATVDGEEMSVRALGRIAAQTFKQILTQGIRAAERGSIYDEYVNLRGQILTGRVLRWEGGSLVIQLERVEALLPRSEQIPGDSHQPEDRIRAMVLDVREQPGAVKIILSRTHPDFIRAMFQLEVPEVGEHTIEIKALAREAGYRTKVAVNSLDPKVDAVGACVGHRGSRIKSIVDELGGEKIDIVRWNESSKILIANALKPAEVAEIALCFELGRATVVVTDDQLSLAIGKRGQNVRLAARLTGWDIDILTPEEFNQGLDTLEKALREIEGVDSTIVDQVIAMGMVSVLDVEEVGPEPLVNELGMEQEQAQHIVVRCAEEAKRVADAQAAEKLKAQQQQAVGQQAGAAGQTHSPAESAPTAAPPAGEQTAPPPAEPGETPAPASAGAEPSEDDTAGPTGDALAPAASEEALPAETTDPTTDETTDEPPTPPAASDEAEPQRS